MGVYIRIVVGKRQIDVFFWFFLLFFGLLDIHGHGAHGLIRTSANENYPFVYNIKQQDNTEFIEAARF